MPTYRYRVGSTGIYDEKLQNLVPTPFTVLHVHGATIVDISADVSKKDDLDEAMRSIGLAEVTHTDPVDASGISVETADGDNTIHSIVRWNEDEATILDSLTELDDSGNLAISGVYKVGEDQLAIDHLADVDTTTTPPSVDNVLGWSGSKWEPRPSGTGGGGPGSDTTAIHDNVASEISAITAKGTPVAADFLVIEDSAAANVKKSITMGDIDHDALTNFVAAEHVDWAGAGAGTIHTDNYIEGGPGTDTTAIHDNVNGEISAITAKATPTTSDFILIEDAAASNAKKRITIGDLPGGGGTDRGTFSWVLNGKVIATEGLDGVRIPASAGTITAVWIWRETAGTGGSTTVDVNKNGTTIFTTQSNRPVVTAAGGDNQKDQSGTINVTSFSAGDLLSIDIDTVETGNPQDIIVMVEVEYT